MVSSAEEAVDVARRERPVAVALVSAPGLDASGVLMELKRRADVRHLPVHVFEEGGTPARWWAAGAAFVHSAAGDEEAAAMLDHLAALRSRNRQVVLVVDPDDQRRHDLVSLIGGESITVVGAHAAQDAITILDTRTVHCVVLDEEISDELLDLVDDVSMRRLDDGTPLPLVLIERDQLHPVIPDRVDTLSRHAPGPRRRQPSRVVRRDGTVPASTGAGRTGGATRHSGRRLAS